MIDYCTLHFINKEYIVKAYIKVRPCALFIMHALHKPTGGLLASPKLLREDAAAL